MNSSPRSEKFKKILNDELDNLEFLDVFGKPVTITKADSLEYQDEQSTHYSSHQNQ